MKRYLLLPLLLAWALALAPAFEASAQSTNYVAVTGVTGTPDGQSWSTAWTNIQTALGRGSNTVIYMKGETFNISTQLVWTSSYVRIEGGYAGVDPGPGARTGTPTVIRQTNTQQRIISITGVTNGTLKNATISGAQFSMTNGTVTGGGIYILSCTNFVLADCAISTNVVAGVSGWSYFYGAGFCADASYGSISGCLFSANRQSGGLFYGRGGGVYLSGGAWTIVDSVLRHNTMSSSSEAKGAGIYSASGTHELRNCVLSGNNGVGSSLANTGGDGAFVAGGTLTFRNCDVLNNGGIGIYNSGGTVIVRDSIVRYNADDLSGTVDVQYSCISDTNTGTGVIYSDPRFERGIYLVTNSPCVDAGSTAAATYGMSNLTMRADGIKDTGPVDIGYHFSTGMNMAAAELYVAETGSDTVGNGSAGNPYRTITKALSQAANGTRVHIAAGQYTNGVETFPVAISNLYGVQLLGTNATTTVVNAKSANRVISVYNALGDSRIESLSVINGSATNPTNGIGIYAWGSGLDIVSCVITGNTGNVNENITGNQRGIGISAEHSSGTITGCLVRANRIPSVSGFGQQCGGAIYLEMGQWTVADCSILTNYVRRPYSGCYLKGAGIWANGGKHVIRNCVVAHNILRFDGGTRASEPVTGDGIYLEPNTSDGGVSLVNVTVADNSGEGLNVGGGTVFVTNSILWGNGVDATGTMTLAWCNVSNAAPQATRTNCISADPLFVNAPSNDYHLKSRGGHWDASAGIWVIDQVTSPCVDAGDPSDLRWQNESWPNGRRINMGAYGGTYQASKPYVPMGTLFQVK